jgi:hypothetical protein
MKKNYYSIVLALFFATSNLFAVTHHIYITSSGASPKYTNPAEGDTTIIHATPAFPVKNVVHTNWLQGVLGTTMGIRTANVYVTGQTYERYYLCTTHLNDDAFKFGIAEPRNLGVRVEPCPILNYSQPIKVFVDTAKTHFGPGSNLNNDSLYIWAWIDGASSLMGNGSWSASSPENLMTNEGNGVWSYTFPNMNALVDSSAMARVKEIGYFRLLVKTRDGVHQTTDRKIYIDICSSNLTNTEQNPPTISTIRAFPNPSSVKITLDANDINGAVVSVFDALGRKCSTAILGESADFDIQNLANGVYFGQVLSSNKTLYRFKFIKN